MMMPARAMNVAMGNLVSIRCTYLDNLDIKGEGFAGHRVVGIHIRELEPDLGDDHMAPAMLCLHLGDHARFPAPGTDQMLDGYTLNGIRLAGTVGFIRRDGHTKSITCLAAFQSLFQPPDNTAVAMQVGVRLSATGVFNFIALFISHNVVKQDHLILFDWHSVLWDGLRGIIIASGGVCCSWKRSG